MNIKKMSLNQLWEEINQKANEHPEYIKDMNASYTFNITGDDSGKYGLIFNGGKTEIVTDGLEDADCSLTMSVDNFKKLLEGNLNATTAFMTGRLKVKGNISLALKLESLLKRYSF